MPEEERILLPKHLRGRKPAKISALSGIRNVKERTLITSEETMSCHINLDDELETEVPTPVKENPMPETQNPTTSTKAVYNPAECNVAHEEIMEAESRAAAAKIVDSIPKAQWKVHTQQARFASMQGMPASERFNSRLEEIPYLAGTRNLLGKDPVSFGRNVHFLVTKGVWLYRWLRG